MVFHYNFHKEGFNKKAIEEALENIEWESIRYMFTVDLFLKDRK